MEPARLETPPRRSQSIDAFRGLTIALMIFVNWTADVSGLPMWMKHAPADVDGFTYADWVFPGFLFAVGLSMPLALSRQPPGEFRRRLAWRAFSLIFLGVMMVDLETYAAEATGLAAEHFGLLFYGAVFAVWGSPKWLVWPRRIGIVLLAVLALLLRHQTASGEVTGLRPEWWGILGIIGWAYLVSALAWKYTGSNRRRILGVLAATSALWILDRVAPLSAWLPPARWLDFATLAGSHAALVVAGTFCGSLVHEERADTARVSMAFGGALLVCGFVSRIWIPFSKIGGTLSWALACAGLGALFFAVCRFLVDDRGLHVFDWVLPAGRNALFAYLLPDLVVAVFDTLAGLGVDLWSVFWWSSEGAGGVANALVWTALVLGLTTLATRQRYLLKL